jgi:hypothetical protein
MADPRLDSCHFGLIPRRQAYRRSREAVLEARGLMTLAGEQLRGLLGAEDDWPSLMPFRPDQVIPGTRFLLVDHQADCYFLLETGLNTIGRLPNNDIVLEDNWISRRHCVIIVHACGGCELHDTASLNGTWVNGQRVQQPVRLASGDWIQVCHRLLLFVSEKDYQAERGNDANPATDLC